VREAERTASGPPPPHGQHGDGDGERDERDQDQRVVQGALGREHERQQQDRPELADCPGGEQVAPELGLELTCVGEDRDQRADRGRRERGAHVDQRDDDAERGEDPAQRVRDDERQRPAGEGEAQGMPFDPADVDLVAGEEEEHPEAER